MAVATPYITPRELGQLSALPEEFLDTLESEEPGALSRALDAATAEVNGYLAARYPLPFTSIGDDIRQRVADIAAYRLSSRHGLSLEGADEDLRQRYEDAIAWLRDVAKGLITPDVTATTPGPTRIAQVRTRCPRGW